MALYLNSDSIGCLVYIAIMGNNRLQQQANARNIYGNNMNGRRLINNPQTSNYNSSNFNTYNVGAQTEYIKGTGSDIVTGQRYVVSVGGIADIPPTIPPRLQ